MHFNRQSLFSTSFMLFLPLSAKLCPSINSDLNGYGIHLGKFEQRKRPMFSHDSPITVTGHSNVLGAHVLSSLSLCNKGGLCGTTKQILDTAT